MMALKIRTRTLFAVALMAALPLAGWAASPAAHAVADAAASQDSVYLGYYQEDPATNPEDPTMGSVYLNLPASDSDFSGTMYFTYLGCQSHNLGTISGTKAGALLKGQWNGSIDGTEQTGTFTGTYSAAQSAYAGTFTVAGGKQRIDIPACISYYIAPKGSFELFAIGKQVPSNFSVSMNGNTVSWNPPSGAVMTLVYVLDPAIAHSGHGNATVWQTLVLGPQGSANLSNAGLLSGHAYLIAVGASDSRFHRLSFASSRFTAP
jgi:hypothetical protein